MTTKQSYSIAFKNKEIYSYLKSQITIIDLSFSQYRLEWEEAKILNENYKVVMTLLEWHNDDVYGWVECYCTKEAITYIRKQLSGKYPNDAIEVENLDSRKDALSGERTTYINNKEVAYRAFSQKALPPYDYEAKYYEYKEEHKRMCLVKTRVKEYKEDSEKITTRIYDYDEDKGKEVLVNRDVHIEWKERRIYKSILYNEEFSSAHEDDKTKNVNGYSYQERNRFINLLSSLHNEWFCLGTVCYDAPSIVKSRSKEDKELLRDFGLDYTSPLSAKESSY